MDPSNHDGILGLFPAFGLPGGIQASGEVAWEGITRDRSNGFAIRNAYLFCYGKSARNEPGSVKGDVLYTQSKLGAVRAALKGHWPVRLVLVWHIALLKLLPFFRVPNAQVALFLHGVEAWRRHHWRMRGLMNRIDLFLSNSEHTWERFVDVNHGYGHARHCTVHLGIDSPLEDSIATPGNSPIALMMGRLSKIENYKGHKEVIGAWPIVLEKVPEAKLWIIGGGDLRKELERLVAKLTLQDNIRFCGQVSESKKQELLRYCRCLVLPSHAEGFGLVYIEAMRQGRPCLVSTLDAGREVVNPPDAGVAVDLDNPNRLAESICHLLNLDSDWTTLSQGAKRRYERLFTAHHFQERLTSALLPLM